MGLITIDELQRMNAPLPVAQMPVQTDISDAGILYTLLNSIADLIPNNDINNYNNLIAINATDNLIMPNYVQRLPEPPVQQTMDSLE
jgi:hypothetical protein